MQTRARMRSKPGAGKTYFTVSWVVSGAARCCCVVGLELATVRDYRPKQEEPVRRPRTPNIQLPDQLPPDLS